MNQFLLICISFFVVFHKGDSQWIENCPRPVSWSLQDTATNKSCILMTGTYEFIIPYTRLPGQESYATVEVSPDAEVSGSCGTNSSKIQTITLTWPVPSKTNVTGGALNTVAFAFTRNITSGREDGVEGFFCLQNVKAVLHTNPVEFRNSSEPDKVYTLQAGNLELLSTALTMSYFCSTAQDVPVGNGTLRLAHAQIEAFHAEPLENDGLDFGTRSYCFADGLRMLITAVVLITILVATGGFVIYLFRRKRTQSSYNSLD